ncbi:hypothetical protein NQZ68_005383 [Dissostichus eleginoides]|nr:hypothetical protein NQZ68_005383 [Dissostichus eleginoides]
MFRYAVRQWLCWEAGRKEIRGGSIIGPLYNFDQLVFTHRMEKLGFGVLHEFYSIEPMTNRDLDVCCFSTEDSMEREIKDGTLSDKENLKPRLLESTGEKISCVALAGCHQGDWFITSGSPRKMRWHWIS